MASEDKMKSVAVPSFPQRPPKVTADKTNVCKECRGLHYRLEISGEWAKALSCNCIGRCLRCRGRGYELTMRQDGYTFLQPCECQVAQRRIEKFNQTLVPSHFTYKDLSNYEVQGTTTEVVESLRTFARAFPIERHGILLVGNPGVGKTHLAVGIVKELTLQKGIGCLFKDFFLLLNEVKDAYSRGDFDVDVLRPLSQVEVLVIDELGKGRTNSEWEHGLLDQIICKRYNQMKTTIFTTNFPIDQGEGAGKLKGGSMARDGLGNLSSPHLPTLEERVGDRIYSRIRQMCQLVRINASDYRRRGVHVGDGRR